MEELKRRVTIIDDAMGPFRKSGTLSVPNVELACLQLRKVFELIAFASLSANRERYARIRASYDKDGDISRITKLIENVNPEFLPIPITERQPNDPNEMLEIVDHPERRISRKELVSRHGRLSDLLHAQNPYRPFPDYKRWHNLIAAWRDEVVQLLSSHKVWVEKDRTFYRVVMNALPGGDIQVAVMELVERPS